MRSKAKYMAIVAVLLVAVLAVALVACGGNAKPSEVIANTADWMASANNAKITDEVELKNISVEVPDNILASGGLVNIGGIKVKSTRQLLGDVFKISLEVSDITGLKFSSSLDNIVNGIIDLSNISQVRITLDLTYNPSSEDLIVGVFHGYKLGSLIPSLPAEDSNPNNESFVLKKEAVTGENHPKEEKLVNAIVDLLDNTIMGGATIVDGNDNTYATGTSNVGNIMAIAKMALDEYGEEIIYKYDYELGENVATDYTAKSLLNLIFNTVVVEDIFKDVVKFSTFDLTNVSTQKIDGKEVLAKATLKNTDKYQLFINNKTSLNIKNNIATVLSTFGIEEPLIGTVVGIVFSGEVQLNIKNIIITSSYETI